MLRAAVIDAGTNSVKIVVGESDGDVVRILADHSVITRLGQGLDASLVLGTQAQRRTLSGVRSHLQAARGLGVDETIVVATSAVREAKNSSQFLLAAQSELGVEVEVLSEGDEGRLSYEAVALDPTLGLGSGELAVLDVGGGSTEFASGRHGVPTFCRSLKLGAVRLTERFVRSDPPSVAEITELTAAVEDTMEHPELVEGAVAQQIGDRVRGTLTGVGGSAVNLARINMSVPATMTSTVHGAKMSREEVAALLSRLSEMTLQTRKRVIGLDPDRADIIIAGAIILYQAMVVVRAEELLVSTHGLRYGALYEMLRQDGPT
jgi:exopolyphosphatase / guanosine-5'-triphosphate,3'-diphosphate pyrophosphatase